MSVYKFYEYWIFILLLIPCSSIFYYLRIFSWTIFMPKFLSEMYVLYIYMYDKIYSFLPYSAILLYFWIHHPSTFLICRPFIINYLTNSLLLLLNPISHCLLAKHFSEEFILQKRLRVGIWKTFSLQVDLWNNFYFRQSIICKVESYLYNT